MIPIETLRLMVSTQWCQHTKDIEERYRDGIADMENLLEEIAARYKQDADQIKTDEATGPWRFFLSRSLSHARAQLACFKQGLILESWVVGRTQFETWLIMRWILGADSDSESERQKRWQIYMEDCKRWCAEVYEKLKRNNAPMAIQSLFSEKSGESNTNPAGCMPNVADMMNCVRMQDQYYLRYGLYSKISHSTVFNLDLLSPSEECDRIPMDYEFEVEDEIFQHTIRHIIKEPFSLNVEVASHSKAGRLPSTFSHILDILRRDFPDRGGVR